MAYAVLARRGGDRAPARYAFFGSGLIVCWLALETPIDPLADRYLQTVHMTQHVLLGVVAPPLLVLGLSPALAGALLAKVPGLRALVEPVPAQVIAAAVMIGWHLPVLYDWTLASEPVHVLEHVSFVGAGVLFWWPVLEASSEHLRWRLSDGARLVYVLAGTIPQDTVALVLQFSRTVFYQHYLGAPQLLAGFTPVVDQNVSGAVLMLAGKTSFAIALMAIFFRWFRREQALDRAG